MVSAGYVDKSVDKDMEREQARFQKNIEKLHKEAKGYLDSARALTSAQVKISSTIDEFYEEGSPMGYAAIQYKDTVSKLDQESRTELEEAFKTAVLDHIGKLIGTFPDYNDALKKRDRKCLDYDRTRTTVRKIVESPPVDSGRLQKAEQEAEVARLAYEPLNQQLIEDIPKLIELRIPYLEPCFESMIKTQLTFNKDAFERMDAVKKAFEYGGTKLDDSVTEQQIQNVIAQIKELTICGGIST